jgi:hypothetical protein
VQQHRRDRRGTSVERASDHRVELGGASERPGSTGGDEDVAGHPGFVQAGDGLKVRRGTGGPRLGFAPPVVIESPGRDGALDVGAAERVGESIEVAEDEGALGEDRTRVAGLGEHVDDAPGEAYLSSAGW